MANSYVFGDDESGDDIIGDLLSGDNSGLDIGDLLSGDADVSGADDLSTLMQAISGQDDSGDDIIGAIKAAKKKKALHKLRIAMGGNRFPVKAGLSAMINARGIDYKPFTPRKVREFTLGFDSVTPIPPGGTAQIISLPQVPFKGTRLVVPSDIAGLFLILDLRVGKNSQFVAAGAVPARVYAENGVSVTMSLDTAQVSQQIVLSIQNFSGGPARFTAALIGTAVED